MGILRDEEFESGKVDNEKVNDIIATVSFISDSMGKFLENSILQEIYDLSAALSKQPEIGISKATKLPNSKIVHWTIEKMSYREKIEICKKVAPSLFNKKVNQALGEMGEIRNRVAHEWFRGGIISQQDRDALDEFCKCYSLNQSIKDINDEYNRFQKLYDERRDFILTLEQKASSEHLNLANKP